MNRIRDVSNTRADRITVLTAQNVRPGRRTLDLVQGANRHASDG
jgi:hypothetical protein